MKICIITNLYKPFERGGAERVVEVIVSALKSAGHDIIIITTKPGKAEKPDSPEKIYYLNSVYYDLNRIPYFFRFFYHLFDLFNFINYRKVREILKNEKCSLVLTHNLKGLGLPVMRAASKEGVNRIHTLHDIQLIHPSGQVFYGKEKKIDSIAAKIYCLLGRFIIDSPEVVVSPSGWLLEEHRKRGFFRNSKCLVMNNPVKAEGDAEISRSAGEEGPLILLYVGQLEKHKGIRFLIDTFQELSGNFVLYIIGDGQEKDFVEKAVLKDERIIFYGRKSGGEVRRAMLNSDCLIVPSLCYENSPTVIYEALTARLPVIAARIGGITELIHEAGGILFNPGDGPDLMKKIKIMGDKHEAVKRGMENFDIKKFSAKRYAEKLLKSVS